MLKAKETLAVLIILAASLPAQEAAQVAKASEYWPSDSWEVVDPKSVGMNAAKLAVASKYILANRSISFLVLRGGRIVHEAYGKGGGSKVRRRIASATKSMTSILVGMAIDQDKLELDQRVVDFLPRWRDTKKSPITIRHLLTMTSGLNPRKLMRQRPTGDQFIHNAAMPVVAAPGDKWAYNTPAYHMLFRILEKSTEMDLARWTRERLLEPLGMQGSAWNTRPAGELTNYFNLSCTARDMARFGLFVMRGGRWGEQRLVSQKFFKAATTPSQEQNPAYGYLFWLNAKKGHSAGGRRTLYRFPGAPRDLIACLGKGGQQILAIPSQDLVIVRQGERAADSQLAQRMARMVLSAIEGGGFPDEPAPAAAKSKNFLQRFDADKDGKLSREEFGKSRVGRQRPKTFAQVDKDGDGYLSIDELRSFAERRG